MPRRSRRRSPSWAGACFVKKACRDGYDGRGQARATRGGGLPRPGPRSAASPCVAERAIDLEAECSVLVARRPGGECAVYPPALNHHVNGVLSWSVLPGPLPPTIGFRATELSSAARSPRALASRACWWSSSSSRAAANCWSTSSLPRPHNSFPLDRDRLCSEPVRAGGSAPSAISPLGSTRGRAAHRRSATCSGDLLGGRAHACPWTAPSSCPACAPQPLRQARRAPGSQDGAPGRRGLDARRSAGARVREAYRRLEP